MGKWISVKDHLPEIERTRYSKHYLVLVKSRTGRSIVKFGKWEKKLHRKVGMNESTFDVLEESPLAIWRVSNFKGKDVTH